MIPGTMPADAISAPYLVIPLFLCDVDFSMIPYPGLMLLDDPWFHLFSDPSIMICDDNVVNPDLIISFFDEHHGGILCFHF